MDIFDNTAQAVRFAFVLQQYDPQPGPGLAGIVRLAFRETHIEPPALAPGETPIAQASVICAYTKQLLRTLHADLLGYERASLIAAYSRSWPERRAAAEALAPFHAHLLARLLDNRYLIGKLVTRHYIAERERGASWALQSLADEHKAAGDRVKRAARLIDENARKLEQIALDNLAHVLNDKKESAHV